MDKWEMLKGKFSLVVVANRKKSETQTLNGNMYIDRYIYFLISLHGES